MFPYAARCYQANPITLCVAFSTAPQISTLSVCITLGFSWSMLSYDFGMSAWIPSCGCTGEVLTADGSVQSFMVCVQIVVSLRLPVCKDEMNVELELDHEKGS